MPDNFNKPSYQRKQKLYVEKSQKESNKKPSKKAKKNKKNSDPLIKNYVTPNIPKKHKKDKNFKKPFIKFLLLVLVVTATATVTYGSYTYLTKDITQTVEENLATQPAPEPKLQKNVNVLLIGLDKVSYHTDTMIVANLNTEDGSIELISIPRDTYATLPEEVVEEVRNSSERPIMPRSGVMKLTEIITYTQDEQKGLEILTDYIAYLLNIKIDSYVVVDLESFSYLVDAVGGIYFDVPQKMYYNDNAQDLHIDLEAGYQLLDGDKAEQLIRFRKGSGGTSGYATGDLGRIEVQQAFLKELINQVLGKENFISNLPSLAKTYYNYVTTNISLLDIPKYVSYAKAADPNNITTYSLPVDYEYIDGKSYAVPKEEEVALLSDQIFYDIIPPTEVSDPNATSIYNETTRDKSSYTITVLNGSGKKGFAGKTRDLLTSEGFTVDGIGDYTGEHIETTRFFGKSEEDVKAFATYFDSYEYVHTPSQAEDIVIVLGTEETLKGKQD